LTSQLVRIERLGLAGTVLCQGSFRQNGQLVVGLLKRAIPEVLALELVEKNRGKNILLTGRELGRLFECLAQKFCHGRSSPVGRE
jgi:hypothetical protein